MIDEELLRTARDEVSMRLASDPSPNGSDAADEDGEADRVRRARSYAGDFFRRHARDSLRGGKRPLTTEEEEEYVREVLNSLFGLAGFQRYLDDPDVEDLVANGHDEVFVRRAGSAAWERVGPVAADDAELVSLISSFAVQFGLVERQFTPSSPRLSLTLPNASRLHAVMSVSHRPSVTIARRRLVHTSLDDLVKGGTMSPGVRSVLGAALRARLNIIITGGHGAGKTTTLNGCAADLPPSLRIVTIEDPIELYLHKDTRRHPNVVALEVREPNVEGVGAMTARDLLREARHMRPDVIIVGEVRGDEVIPMLGAMSGGNYAGSMCSVHGRSPSGALRLLQSLCVQAPEHLDGEASAQLLATAVNLIVHLDQLRDQHGGVRRVVTSMLEIDGLTEDGRSVATNLVFARGPDGRAVPHAPFSADTKRLLADAGFDVAELAVPAGAWSWPS